MVRRGFLKTLGKLLAVLGGVITGFYSMLRSLFPDVLYEPPPQFSIGNPKNFAEGVTFLPEKRVFVIREDNRFRAISAVCTHLGCTVNYVPLPKSKKVKIRGKEVEELWEFACPCHGSKYYADGTNYEGPAPRPLPHFRIEFSSLKEELIVDTSVTVDPSYHLEI